jgi:hypothetical protein
MKQETLIPFVDRYGEKRTIHRDPHGRLAVKREKKTLALHLNQVIAGMIGARIKARRQALGMTLADLCLKAGLASMTPKTRMWEIENSIRREGVRLGTLYALAFALNCNATDLLPSMDEVKEVADIEEKIIKGMAARD